MSINSKMTAIANAIRGKTGKAEVLTLDQMATEIAGIEAGGGGYSLDDIASRTEPSGELTFGVAKIENYAFHNCGGITAVNLPTVTTLGAMSFYGCKNLKTINTPVLKAFGQNCLQGTAIEELYAPACLGIDYSSLGNMKALKEVDLGVDGKSIAGAAFISDAALTTIILRHPTAVSVGHINAFQGTPFASGGTGGTVYVPSALIETYKTATNWSTLYAAGTCNFVALEGSEYE